MTNNVDIVSFHGHPLTIVTCNDQQLVAMKPICEGIGLDWSSQYSRIMRDEVLLSYVVITTMRLPNDSQRRDVVCLPLEYLNGWLFGIDVKRCREEIRPALLKYKRECYAALAAHWQKKEVKPKEQQPSLLGRRWLVSVDHEGKEHVSHIPNDACVMTTQQMLQGLTEPNGIPVSTEEMFAFIAAATANLKRRMNWQTQQLKLAKEKGFMG